MGLGSFAELRVGDPWLLVVETLGRMRVCPLASGLLVISMQIG